MFQGFVVSMIHTSAADEQERVIVPVTHHKFFEIATVPGIDLIEKNFTYDFFILGEGKGWSGEQTNEYYFFHVGSI